MPIRKTSSKKTTPVVVKPPASRSQIPMQSAFDKSIGFATSFRPNTLINKMVGAYSALKDFMSTISKDKYIDDQEGEELLMNISKFTDKLADIVEILELDESGNQKELNQANILFEKAREMFVDMLALASSSTMVDE